MKKSWCCALVFASFTGLEAQQSSGEGGQLFGNFQFDGQLYNRDPVIDPDGDFFPNERFLGQGFANFVYQHGNFRSGVRYENYQNVILGYPEGFRGEGITFRYAQFVKDGLDITVGNFYEQFGSGMVFRSFEERGLGLDNAMDGVRLKYSPFRGLDVTGVIGRQRFYFETGPGIVRGLNADLSLSDLIARFSESKTRVILGGSFVSKYQRDNDPVLVLPENVGAGSGRLQINRGGFGWNTEVVYKANDPSADNGRIYRPGNGVLTTMTYTRKGLGVLLAAKRIDNMSFRSDRNAGQFDLMINYLPPTTKLHTYALPSLYPYAVQLNGEMGIQAEVTFNIPKGSYLGGKYGTVVSVNFSDAYSIYKDSLPGVSLGERGTDGYRTSFFRQGQIKYFQDFNVEIKRKLNRSWKMMFTYYNIEYAEGILERGITDTEILVNNADPGMVYINAAVLELQYRIKPKQSLRMEFQGLFSKQYRGDMAMVLVEYSVAPSWFVAVQNIYNYGHPNEAERIQYPLTSFGYTAGTTRFQFNYGRQQQGIFCVGGICRVVPPSNGLSMTITSNF
jgi:hypothetical protein